MDDSPFARRLIHRLLEESGQFVVVGHAANGEEALECVRRLRPDVVTLDCHMPGLSGVETLRRLRRESNVPVVLVSGAPSLVEDLDRHAAELDVVGVVTKTFSGRSVDLTVFAESLCAHVRRAADRNIAQ
ncbi:response regulator [bacterium]|nr:response regulator [bacterium]